ncbi:unnamed protein product [Phaedon cochleariae]|uniref:Mutator-like transposase domain-containing protein n=1 Tax=Phaedon cochleariae TaxID=80249 RepID=A0A9N9X115_PHACE|nr:unnamed protein product [Phaedon cochleariae]
MVVDGFNQSEEMHGVRYLKFIGDGDSSVFSKIQHSVRYGKEVRKIECTNHALENYGKRLRTMKEDTQINHKRRKLLTNLKIQALTKRAKTSIYEHAKNAIHNVDLLRSDLRNGLHHVYGDHSNCREGICNTVGDMTNIIIPELKSSTIYNHLNARDDSFVAKEGSKLQARDMSFSDDIPPTLPSANVLKKAKQEEIGKRLGLTSTDPVKNLQIVKHTTHEGSIHAIGTEPISCIGYQNRAYYMKLATKVKEYFSMLLMLQVAYLLEFPFYSKTSKREINQNLKNRKTFICTKICGNEPDIDEFKSCQVYQMISARHDASFSTFFFHEIMRSGAPRPKIMVTDFGKVSLIGVASALANCSDLKNYMSICYKLIVLGAVVEHPTCCLRLDVSHFIAQIARWKCLRNLKSKVRQFNLRALEHVYLMTDFSEIEKVLGSILIVALSEHIGTDRNGQQYSSNEYLSYVDYIIRGTPNIIEPIEPSENGNDNDSEEFFEIESILDSNDSTDSTWIDRAKSLYKEAENKKNCK